MPRTRPAITCKATTRDGRPCRSYAMPGSDHCRVHQGAAPSLPAAAPGDAQRAMASLYSRFMTDEDVAALARPGTEQALADEIAFTRVVIRRLADLIAEADGVAEATRLAHALFRGTGRVADLLRAQQTLSRQAAEGLMQAVEQALEELGKEWGLEL